jgi:GNAT superfamily N-acetyltransferase
MGVMTAIQVFLRSLDQNFVYRHFDGHTSIHDFDALLCYPELQLNATQFDYQFQCPDVKWMDPCYYHLVVIFDVDTEQVHHPKALLEWSDREEMHLCSLHHIEVLPSYRGCGLGERVLTLLCQAYVLSANYQIKLSSTHSARGFYFRVLPRIPGLTYYHDTIDSDPDAIDEVGFVLHRELSPP